MVNISRVYQILEKEALQWHVPVVELIEIQTKDTFKVLVATMLSARTQDQTTSAACKRLFKTIKNCTVKRRITSLRSQFWKIINSPQ